MEASKLTISPETLRFNKLPAAKKTALRRQNIIDLIKSKPFGTPITLAEFAAVGAFKPESAYALLKTMITKGIISKDKISRGKIAYSVNGVVNVVKPAQTELKQPQMLLSEYAKEFAWVKNSDSLREFVQYMDGKELDLRRQMGGV